MSDEQMELGRKEFEQYAAGEKYYRHDFTLFAGNAVKGRTYVDMITELAYRAWQASRMTD